LKNRFITQSAYNSSGNPWEGPEHIAPRSWLRRVFQQAPTHFTLNGEQLCAAILSPRHAMTVRWGPDSMEWPRPGDRMRSPLEAVLQRELHDTRSVRCLDLTNGGIVRGLDGILELGVV
jgi:hypothetical protein